MKLGLTLWQGHGTGCAELAKPLFMLTVGSFAIAFVAVLGCVWWACLDDSD
jgi:hypothetical protein